MYVVLKTKTIGYIPGFKPLGRRLAFHVGTSGWGWKMKYFNYCFTKYCQIAIQINRRSNIKYLQDFVPLEKKVEG